MPPELLADRYPEIYFALQFGGVESTREKQIVKEIEIPSEEIEVLYVFGLGSDYSALQSWLHKNPSRQLIILEDDLASFAGVEEEMIDDCQVHLRYVTHWQDTITTCARDFPCRRIEVFASGKYAKTRSRFFSRLRMKLLRTTGLAYTYFSEALHAHLVIGTNLLHNVPHLVGAFDANRLAGKFHDVPAIICGAGPSLGPAAAKLAELEDRALIFAGGSAVTALGNLGIHPHIALAIDPNKEEHDRFKASVVQEIPFIYGHRLRHDVFGTFNGPAGYIRSATGGSAETWIEEKLKIAGDAIGPELGPEAMSITTLAFALAHSMGCNPIILIGVDLSYVDSKRYAPGVMRDSSVNTSALSQETEHLERLIKRKNGQGKYASTLVRWVMEAEALGNFTKKHPETDFFNASEKGLRIPHLPFLSLDDFSFRYATKHYDLRGQLHALAHSTQFTVTPNDIQELIRPLAASFKALQKITQEAAQELNRLENDPLAPLDSGKLLALELQIVEEPAFPFLESVGLAFDYLKRRRFLSQDRAAQLTFTRAKWVHLASVINHYMHLLRNL